jgi:hypothetical protein
MHVVAIDGWKEESNEFAQAVADALGIMPFEARQRMIGGGPAVVASFADPQQALALEKKLIQRGIATLVIDSTTVLTRGGNSMVRRFVLRGWSLHIESADGQSTEIPYEEINMIVPCTSITEHSETKTVTERKISIGKTLLSGGIPMMKKVERKEDVTTEEREKVLFLRAGNRPLFVFRQNAMSYDGLGAAMKLSRELNFSYLISELRRLAPGAVFDDRLLNRASQVRLLGPALNPETNLYLAVEILSRSLRRGRAKWSE